MFFRTAMLSQGSRATFTLQKTLNECVRTSARLASVASLDKPLAPLFAGSRLQLTKKKAYRRQQILSVCRARSVASNGNLEETDLIEFETSTQPKLITVEISNLPLDHGKEDVRELFREEGFHGRVVAARDHPQKEGVVQLKFQDPQHARAAIAKYNDKYLLGQKLSVAALPQEPRTVASLVKLPQTVRTGFSQKERLDEARNRKLAEANGGRGLLKKGSARGRGLKVDNVARLRPGDWECPGCGLIVFASKDVCFKCGHDKNPGSKVAAKARAGTTRLSKRQRRFRSSGLVERREEERAMMAAETMQFLAEVSSASPNYQKASGGQETAPPPPTAPSEVTFNYYEILEVDPESDAQTIKLAFREKAKKLHPDINPSEEASREFVQCTTAYEVLSDSDMRRKYNMRLELERGDDAQSFEERIKRARTKAELRAVEVLAPLGSLSRTPPHFLRLLPSFSPAPPEYPFSFAVSQFSPN